MQLRAPPPNGTHAALARAACSGVGSRCRSGSKSSGSGQAAGSRPARCDDQAISVGPDAEVEAGGRPEPDEPGDAESEAHEHEQPDQRAPERSRADEDRRQQVQQADEPELGRREREAVPEVEPVDVEQDEVAVGHARECGLDLPMVDAK